MSAICEWPEGCENQTEGRTSFCATHNHAQRKAERELSKKITKIEATQAKLKGRKTLIKPVSDKMAEALRVYSQMKKGWLDGKMCAVFPHLKATQVHHSRGKVGYYDQMARDNDIPLLIDDRFWLAVSSEGHRKITDDSKFAIENGFSFLRTEKPQEEKI